jgi:hypothetical protein
VEFNRPEVECVGVEKVASGIVRSGIEELIYAEWRCPTVRTVLRSHPMLDDPLIRFSIGEPLDEDRALSTHQHHRQHQQSHRNPHSHCQKLYLVPNTNLQEKTFSLTKTEGPQNSKFHNKNPHIVKYLIEDKECPCRSHRN